MAHFYGTVQGHRGAGSRCGSKAKGLWGHLRGWGVGVFVQCFHDEKTDTDFIRVYRTRGSGGPGTQELLFTVYENERVEFAEALRERFGIDLRAPAHRS